MSKFITAVLMMASLSSDASMAAIYKPKTTTLDNGLQVVIVENHLAPIVSLSIYYKVGTADDPVEMVGLSHFLEHLMFKGTKNVPTGEFKKKSPARVGLLMPILPLTLLLLPAVLPVNICRRSLSMRLTAWRISFLMR